MYRVLCLSHKLGGEQDKNKMCKSIRVFGRAVDNQIYGKKTQKKKWNYIRKKKKKKYRLPPIPKGTKYNTYIISPQWELRKRQYYFKHKKECFICESIYQITLHHAVYADWGKENDRNLIPLCWDCHKEVHNLLLNDKTIKLGNAHKIYKELQGLQI